MKHPPDVTATIFDAVVRNMASDIQHAGIIVNYFVDNFDVIRRQYAGRLVVPASRDAKRHGIVR